MRTHGVAAWLGGLVLMAGVSGCGSPEAPSVEDPKRVAVEPKPMETPSSPVGPAEQSAAPSEPVAAESSPVAGKAHPDPTDAGRTTDRTEESESNMKRVSEALRAYAEDQGRFPDAAVMDDQGQALLSWRVSVLPYLDAMDLYQQFRLDQPWDSPHNRPLIDRMPDVFCTPDDPAGDGRTRFVVPRTPGSIFAGSQSLPPHEVTDGLEHTILLVRQRRPVVWSKPADFDFGWPDPLVGLDFAGEAVMADGRYRILEDEIIFLPTFAVARFTAAAGDVFAPEAAEIIASNGEAVEAIDQAGGEVEPDCEDPTGKSVWVSLGFIEEVNRVIRDLRPRLDVFPDLRLTSSGFDDDGLAALAGMQNLVGLEEKSFSSTVTDAGMVHLAGLTRLRRLRLSSTQLTDACAVHLEPLTELESLALPGGISDEALERIGRLKKLRVLRLVNPEITEEGFRNLAGLTELEEFHLPLAWHRIDDAALKHMQNMKRLKRLHLTSERVTDEGMQFVQNFSQLRELRLDCPNVTDQGMRFLANLKELRKLEIVRCRFTDAGLAHLAGLSKVEQLTINGSDQFTAEGYAYLRGMTSLRELRLRSVGPGDVLSGLAGMTSIEGVVLEEGILNEPNFDDSALVHLGALPYLDYLSASGADITSAGVAHLRGLRYLRSLDLASTGIDDAALEHVATLPSLEELFASDTKVTSAGVAHLRGLRSLRTLSLSSTGIDDDAVAELEKMTHLESLYLDETGITQAGRQRLKASLPDVYIAFD